MTSELYVDMASSGPSIKRSPDHLENDEIKRPKHHYHHHHFLKAPISIPVTSDPAIQDESHLDDLLNRSISHILQDVGFQGSDPAALASMRHTLDAYLFRLSTYVRQSMTVSRRVQPIPPDFEHAFGRVNLSFDDLRPLLKPRVSEIPTLTFLPPSPPPEDELIRKLPFLNTLREEEGTVARDYIPSHFPDLPSKHTYSSTPILTERDNDPRKIRERAAEDGRHGEEALRKLAAAAFRGDNIGTSGGKEKKLWGRRLESMETMFEKTVKGLAKRIQKDQKDPLAPAPAGSVLSSAMDIDSHNDADTKSKAKQTWNMEMGPIVNCERDFWRRPASARVKEEKKQATADALA